MFERIESSSRLFGVHNIQRYLLYILIAFCIIVPIHYFVAEPFIVSGDSMVPTFVENEYLVIDRITSRFKPFVRGDVIIFEYPLDPDAYFIKRIIGLPGETVEVQNGEITVIAADGSRVHLGEPYRLQENQKKQAESVTKLSKDEYFVMGDNRNVSFDSRVWGPLQKRYIIGRALMRLYPFSRIEFLPGKYEY